MHKQTRELAKRSITAWTPKAPFTYAIAETFLREVTRFEAIESGLNNVPTLDLRGARSSFQMYDHPRIGRELSDTSFADALINGFSMC